MGRVDAAHCEPDAGRSNEDEETSTGGAIKNLGVRNRIRGRRGSALNYKVYRSTSPPLIPFAPLLVLSLSKGVFARA
jgi:hypothetical protein